MTRRLPIVGFTEIERVLRRCGFERVGQRGSHVKLRRADGRTVIVPRHRELARGTLASILRQAGISVEELTDHLGGRRERFLAAGTGARGERDGAVRIEEILAAEMPEHFERETSQ